MRYSCFNCYYNAFTKVTEEPCACCIHRSHFLPEPEYSRQAILALEKELKTKYEYNDEKINQIIDNFHYKVEVQ